MAKASGGTVFRLVTQVVPGIIRPLRALWNQMLGFVFIVMASAAVPLLIRDYKHFNGDFDSVFRLGLEAIFAVMMLYFGVTSLMRARRISRS